MVVASFPMPAGTVFDWHTHEDHQLAWAPNGVLTVLTEQATWVLPPTRALWIPAGLPHETGAATRTLMRSLYVRPGSLERLGRSASFGWHTSAPTVVEASPLLAELIGYLASDELGKDRRAHAETLLADLLTPVAVTTIELRLPESEPARQVAEALRRDPANKKTLAQWGQTVSASERTLARAFIGGTGMPFGTWRTLLRLQAAMPMLAAGDAVGRVAARVGYERPSAFVAAFRLEIGVTPTAYFRPRDRPAAGAEEPMPL